LRRERSVGAGRRGATLCTVLVVVGLASLLGGCGKQSAASKADGLIQAGVKAAKAGNGAAAISDYQAASTANPLSAIAYYDLGVAYGESANVDQARASFQKALLIEPDYKSAIYDLAVLDTPMEPTTAVALYQQLITLDADSPNALFNLGLMLEHSGQTVEGSADVSKAVALDPTLRTRLSTSIITPTTSTTKPTSSTTTHH
jgi:tetratricopeptide (TPR) repeat protein